MVFCSNCGSEVEDGSKFCPSCGNQMDDSAQPENNSTGSLFGDIKKGGLNVKKKLDNYAHGEYKEIERPEGCLYFMNGLQGTLAIYDDYIEFDFTGGKVKKYLSAFGGVKKVYYNQINSIQKRENDTEMFRHLQIAQWLIIYSLPLKYNYTFRQSFR